MLFYRLWKAVGLIPRCRQATGSTQKTYRPVQQLQYSQRMVLMWLLTTLYNSIEQTSLETDWHP
jgi:hypothetical protein